MDGTALPTWGELAARQSAVMRRAMVYAMSGEDELKEDAVAELKRIADQVKRGEFR